MQADGQTELLYQYRASMRGHAIKMWVMGRSTPLNMAPIDYTTSYRSVIVTIALSFTLFELFDDE